MAASLGYFDVDDGCWRRNDFCHFGHSHPISFYISVFFLFILTFKRCHQDQNAVTNYKSPIIMMLPASRCQQHHTTRTVAFENLPEMSPFLPWTNSVFISRLKTEFSVNSDLTLK